MQIKHDGENPMFRCVGQVVVKSITSINYDLNPLVLCHYVRRETSGN